MPFATGIRIPRFPILGTDWASGLSLCAGLILPAAVFATPITVTDDLGYSLSLNKPAERVVSLSPHNTENLFTAGAGDTLVAAVEYSDYPEAAKALPRVGGAQALNLEAIVALKPDLIIAWASGNTPQTLARLADLGYPIYYSEPHDFSTVIDNIRDLAKLTGNDPNTPAIQQLQSDFERLVVTYQNRPQARVFYQIWDQPLMTLSNQHMVGKLITHCGGNNIFGALALLAPTVSTESVLRANPEVILLASSAHDTERWATNWQQWKHLSAIKNQRIHAINPDWVSRQTARLLLGMEQICQALH